MWLSPFRISRSMFLPMPRGVIKHWRKNCGGMRRGTSNGFTAYPILCSTNLHLLLSTQLLSLIMRRLLLSSSEPDRFPIHSRSLRTSGSEWIVLCCILMCLHILYLPALWRTSSWSIAWCRRIRFREGGPGAIVHMSRVLF